MEKQEFERVYEKNASVIERICESAHKLHASVNQTYGKDQPYAFHLDMVANLAKDFAYLNCVSEEDVVPIMFGAYYHDSIEDARLTYNDVMKVAKTFMNDEQALLATEIVYALTNEKGRNRAERANDKYYEGIRTTPYAPFVKLCDRVANITYSCLGADSENNRMKEIYKKEVPHFLASINPHSDDPRFKIPAEMVEVLAEQLIDEMMREEWIAGLDV
ncbi:MAG: hypothetical protein IJ081_04765 [Prevotella sp.]|nr:hypothetical protein [Prevotella sp.]